MWRITLENLLARKFRLISTALSVIIGVAFLAGSLVLIDTLGRTFDDLFAVVNEGIDAQVRDADVVESDFGDIRGRIDEAVADQIAQLPEVEAAEAQVFGFAQLVDATGQPMGNPGQGAPTFGFNWTDIDALNPMKLTEGTKPLGPDDVVIDAKSAKDGPFLVGDQITILLQGPPRQFTVSGIAKFGTADSPLGASVAIFEADTAQEVLAEPGKVDTVDVVAAAGVSEQQVRDAIDAELADTYEVITGEALTEENQSEVADALSFFNTFMLIFAAIALFVASFIIFNTFSILVAQRTRELGLLRSLGARRSQVLGAVLLEAVIVGLFASAVGIGAGLVVAQALKALIAAVGISIPAGSVVFGLRTVWMSVLVGVGVTSVAALMPSRRASAVSPMEAIRSVGVDDSGTSLRRLVSGSALLVVGLALLFSGLFGDASNLLAAIGGGVLLIFVSLAVLGPVLALPFVSLVGRPLARLQGVPGELARENAMRNPARTSTTAAALMIGVGLVAAISIFASSAKASINKIIDDSFVGDLVIDSGAFGFGGLSPELARELNELPEVQAASGVRLGFAEIEGETETLFGVDRQTMGSIVDVEVLEGRVEDMGPNDIAVFDEFAEDQGWTLGSQVQAKFAETGSQPLTVTVMFGKDDLTGNFFVANEAFEANFPNLFDFQVYVLRAPEATAEDARLAVEAVASKYANAEVQDLQEFKQAQADQINQLLGIIYVLLALSIFIALIGIANTLALSILERTRELGLLRAVGMTRGQLRSAIRWESVLIALLGTSLGAAVGLFFGWVMVRALESEGFTELRVPVGQLIVIAAIAVVAGVLAATLPARRAAKLDVLRAIGG